MAVEQLRKVTKASGGVDLPLITNEEFAKWLIKEFKMGWKEANDKALHYPQDRKEVALLLKDWMPAISLRGIENVLNSYSRYECSLEYISRDLKILEKYGITPQWHLLRIMPDTLEKNIQALIERKRKPDEYARMERLATEHEKFKNYLDNVEGALVRELHEKMLKIAIEDIEEFVNRTLLQNIRLRTKALENRKVDMSKFTDIGEFEPSKLRDHLTRYLTKEKSVRTHINELTRGMPYESPQRIEEFVEETRGNVITYKIKALEAHGIKLGEVSIEQLKLPIAEIERRVYRQRFIDYLGEETKIPPKDVKKIVDEIPHDLLLTKIQILEEKGKLRGLTDTNFLRMSVTELKTGIAREPPKVLAVHFRDKKGFYKLIDGFDSGMKEAFKEIGKIIEEEGMIIQSEMYEISRRHKVTLLESWVESEVNKKVNFLVHEGSLGIKSVKKEK
jgi:hypothetical protein